MPQPRAVDGGLVATADGVVRAGEELDPVGLGAVRGVVARPVPYAA
ncbi:MAG: hypothetical protein J07HB67_02067, partial [halophilic archaeon J07HB67]